MYNYFNNIKKIADDAKKSGEIDKSRAFYGLLEIAARAKYADLSDIDIKELAEYAESVTVKKVPKNPPKKASAKKKTASKKTAKKGAEK